MFLSWVFSHSSYHFGMARVTSQFVGRFSIQSRHHASLAYRNHHEETLGLKAHAAETQKMSGTKHAEPNMITLAAGKTGGLVWTFDKPGTVDFACLAPGAGMTGKVKVG